MILLALALPPITYILSSIARNPLVSKQPPLPPPSPLLLVLPKGAQIKLLSVEVLQVDISTFWQGISIEEVEVSAYSGGSICFKQEYLHQFYANFEHKIQYSGGSGDSGGFLSILCGDALLYDYEIYQVELTVIYDSKNTSYS